MIYIFFPNAIFAVVYSAALTECFADTAASGIGVLSKKAYDPIRFKRIEVGMSGGMSVLGTAASLIASFVFALIPVAFGVLDAKLYLVVAVSAFVGAIFDSFLGALAQAKFKCTVCGMHTEREEHCDAPTEHIGGLKFIDNDAVNVISVAFSALLSATLFLMI